MKRLPMRKIRDVSRLSAEGLSTRQMAASLSIGRATRATWSVPERPPAPSPARKGDGRLACIVRRGHGADRAQTGRELLSKLQLAHPEAYPDGLLRTVQRRLKIWRAAIARELVFGASQVASDLMTPGALRDVEASRVGGHQNPTMDLTSPSDILREHLVEATA